MPSSPQSARASRRAGFTMIEILMVLIVFGISAMIAIRSVGDTLRRDRVSKTAAVLSTDIEQGFAIAARLRVPVRVRIYDTLLPLPRRQFIVRQRTDTTYKYRVRELRTGDFSLDTLIKSKDSLDIMPNGLATDTLRLTLGVKSKAGSWYWKVIRVTRAGLVKVGNQ
jgi:prepilin-type N-terminal cleavage/methylation domain-containing protein